MAPKRLFAFVAKNNQKVLLKSQQKSFDSV